jgi:hypothetical protein
MGLFNHKQKQKRKVIVRDCDTDDAHGLELHRRKDIEPPKRVARHYTNRHNELTTTHNIATHISVATATRTHTSAACMVPSHRTWLRSLTRIVEVCR